ncbi:TonB-dependent receptor [Tsuneonella mangrovi]|uniref:TonB-dependent receptor n=1 Tax=Tsuneonella mangrovi TaxID=1982042 RepID=UPI000BA1D411|nr:TonB-dependent receptor [Tsuneonella mangrovi]
MKLKYLLAASVVSLSATAILPAPVAAQQITSSIQGTVTDDAGKPVAGATVVVTDTRTGAARTLTTGTDGNFNATNLTSGGPYSVSASASGLEGQTINDIYTSLQGATNLGFSLTSGSGVIVVTGARVAVTQLAVGPGTSFGTQAIESAPTYGRDIQDVIRYDPRITLFNSGGQVYYSCLGGSNRSNSFTVDGIQQGDVFGLNGTAYASRTSAPLPYDAISQIQVQFAPYDVEYDGFTGCQVNAVTKSGSNKFHGSGFYEYADNGLRGTKVAGVPVAKIDPEKRWGVSLGGPIIPDHLFFFGAYSHISTAKAQDDGPSGAGYPNEAADITATQFNDIATIAKNVYGIDPGPLVSNLPYKNDRYFARLDWQINDKHRLEATYQHLKEVSISADDLYIRSGQEAITGLNSFSQYGTDSDYYSGRLLSNWTDNFSTELRYSYSKVDDIQGPVGGGEATDPTVIPRMVIGIDNGGGSTASVLLGPGYYRSANQLNTKIQQASAIAKLTAGDHKFKFGVQMNQAEIYNLFIPNGTGTLVFANATDFANGVLSSGTSGGGSRLNTSDVVAGNYVGAFGSFSSTGNPDDAAAQFKRTIYSAFAQDDWQITGNLNMVAGVRANWYAGDSPKFNPNFMARYGRSNAIGFGNIPIQVLPRVAFTLDAGDFGPLSNNKLRLGVGMFTGGDPLVWFSNAFGNDGFGSGSAASNECASVPTNVLSGGSFTGFPSCVVSAAAAKAAVGSSPVQSIDPNIKMPTVLRANFGLESNLDLASSGFFSNWKLKLDYIYSKYINPFAVADLTQVVNPALGLNGYTIDGRPIYRSIDPLLAGCDAQLQSSSPTPTYTNVTAACFATGRNGAIDLTNSAGYHSQVASIFLAKHFDRGVLTEGGSVDFTIGYAYTDAHDRRAFTSSQATSNFKYPPTFNIQDPAEGRSQFSQKNNISMNLKFTEKFFGDNKTQLGITFNGTSGNPYSSTFSSRNLFAIAYGYDNSLIYLPTGTSDPNISPSSNMTAVQELADYANATKCLRNYVGKSIVKNTCTNPWYWDMDLKISQELPGPGHFFGKDDKIKVYAMVDNFLNMLDNNWNKLSRNTSYGSVSIGDISGVDSAGRYIISKANTAANDYRYVDSIGSVWRIKLGVSYDF